MNNKTFHWLSLDYGKSMFYEYSNSPRPGFEQHVSPKSNKTTYRFYYTDGVIGEFQGVSTRANRALNREELIVQFATDEHVFNVQVPLTNSEGTSFSNYAEDIIKRLDSMSGGTMYKIFCYVISAAQRAKTASEAGIELKGTFRDKKGLAIGTCDENGENYERLEVIDLPKIEFKSKGTSGDRKPTATSIEKRYEAAEVVLLKHVDAYKDEVLKGSSGSSGPTRVPPAATASTIPQATETVDEETGEVLQTEEALF